MSTPVRIPLTVLQCHGRWWIFLVSMAIAASGLSGWQSRVAWEKVQTQTQEMTRLQERMSMVELAQTTPPPAPVVVPPPLAAITPPATQLPLPTPPAPVAPPAPEPPAPKEAPPDGAISLRGLSQSHIRSLLGQPTKVSGRAWLWAHYQEGQTLLVEFDRGHVATWGWISASR